MISIVRSATVLLLCFSQSVALKAVVVRRALSTLKMAAVPSSFYDIVEKDANGNDVSFSQFRGKVVYGVNVASKCGYTASGYALLSRLSALKEQGVEVAIFPCKLYLTTIN